MKNLIKSFLAIASFQKTVLLLLVGLASCKQDNFITPDAPADVAAGSLRESAIPTIPKKHQLIKHGDATLSYLADGRLEMVTSCGNLRGNVTILTKYQYGLNYIKSNTTRNSKLSQEVTYSLDPATGHCVMVKQTTYKYLSGIPYPTEYLYTYQYNTKGQLVNRFDQDYPDLTTEFEYAANGDLTAVTNYAANFNKPGKKVLTGAKLFYDQPTGDPILADKYPINPEEGNFPDPYLRIFGKTGRHLVKLSTYLNSLDGKVYSYQMDADGYVKKRDSYKLVGAALVDSQVYGYVLSEVGLSL
jgi:hypothetical protein